MAEIACFAAGTSLHDLVAAAESYRVSVIPITAGRDYRRVCPVGRKYNQEAGFPVSVTKETDVAVVSGSCIRRK